MATLGVVVAVVGAGLAADYRLEQVHTSEVVEESEAALAHTLAESAQLKGATMESFVRDYSLWNDMVAYAAEPDPSWAKVNLDTAPTSFKLSRLWVFDEQGRLAFDSLGAEADHAVPGLGVFRPERFGAGPFLHTYARTPDGVVELRGAFIQREDDAARSSPPKGYLIAERRWDTDYLSGLEPVIGATPTVGVPGAPCRAHDPEASLSASMSLSDQAGAPIGDVCVIVPDRTRDHVRDHLRARLILALALGPILLLIVAVALRRWVTQPLSALRRALAAGSRPELEAVIARNDDFAPLARTVIERDEALASCQLLERKVHEASRLASLGMVGAMVAHELNNPLAIVLGNAELLCDQAESEGSDPATRQALAAILTQSERMRAVLDRVRSLAKNETAEDFDPQDLNAVVRQALVYLAAELERQGVRLELVLAEGLPAVRGDRTELAAVVQNLVNNARDAVLSHARAARSVIVETRAVEDAVLLTVRDNGPGLDPQVKETVLDPFVTTKPDGSGLGLSIVKSVIERCGGGLAVASSAGGTSFELRLPVFA